ncbi:amino acid transporter [Microbacterium helvum]|uniref:amino acid transporter n=1 Tax=Microbacterium helvum TaxID=2773713 RepID=UPI0029656C81|nr:amino acid transporter [Microbacterium helvum]
MSHESPTRRDLLKPLQLLGMAFGAALFAGIVTLVSMGFFQQRTADEASRAVVVALIIAGVSFIAVLLIVSLLLLAVDPAQVTKQIDKPVLLPDEEAKPEAGDAKPGAGGSGSDGEPGIEASTDPKS